MEQGNCHPPPSLRTIEKWYFICHILMLGKHLRQVATNEWKMTGIGRCEPSPLILINLNWPFTILTSRILPSWTQPKSMFHQIILSQTKAAPKQRIHISVYLSRLYAEYEQCCSIDLYTTLITQHLTRETTENQNRL